MADRGAVRSRLLPVALLGVVAAAGLTGCVDRTDATEDEITRVVTEYFALLEAGKAEAASALDTFDPAEAECPALFTDEVYATVADRPTNLEITYVQHHDAGDEAYATFVESTGEHADAVAYVSVRLDVATQRDVRAQITLSRSGEDWVIRHEPGQVGSLIVLAPGRTAGEVSLQGVCATPLADLSSTAAVYPGTWTVSYTDPGGIGMADEWTASSQGTLMGVSGIERGRVSVEVVPDPAVLDQAQGAMADLVDECVDSLLTSPSCPADLAELVSRYPGPVESVDLSDYPVVTIDDNTTSWRFSTDAPRLTWVDADGDEHETSLAYRGSVAVEDGAVVLTQDPP